MTEDSIEKKIERNKNKTEIRGLLNKVFSEEQVSQQVEEIRNQLHPYLENSNQTKQNPSKNKEKSEHIRNL